MLFPEKDRATLLRLFPCLGSVRNPCPRLAYPYNLFPSLQLLGSFSILNDLATVSDMVIRDVSASSFTASLRLTVPDLNMVGALTTLSYSSSTRTFTFQVRTSPFPFLGTNRQYGGSRSVATVRLTDW